MPPYLAILSLLGVWILFLYLVVNIYLSESLPPLYTKLTGGEFDATVAYLQKAKKVGIYDIEVAPFKEIYGHSVEQAVAIKDEEKNLSLQGLRPSLLQILKLGMYSTGYINFIVEKETHRRLTNILSAHKLLTPRLQNNKI